MVDKKLAILAGNYIQYQTYMEENKEELKEMNPIYIDRMSVAIGMRFYDYRIVGTFYERPDCMRLLEEVKTRTVW